MIYVLGIAGAAFLGVGWVLQQRVAARSIATQRLSWASVRLLIRNLEWWGGIAAAAIGQTLAAWALQDGAITLVEPLMVSSLFFAFAFSAALGRQRICRHEVIGTVLLAIAVAMFLAVAHPRATGSSLPTLFTLMLATGGACGAVLVILAASRGVRRRHAAVATATATAAAAGIFYALQDVATEEPSLRRATAACCRCCISPGPISCFSAPPPVCSSPRRRSAPPGWTGRCPDGRCAAARRGRARRRRPQ